MKRGAACRKSGAPEVGRNREKQVSGTGEKQGEKQGSGTNGTAGVACLRRRVGRTPTRIRACKRCRWGRRFTWGFVAALRSCRMIAKWCREESYASPEAWTSLKRLLPPAFGMRFWYIMRRAPQARDR